MLTRTKVSAMDKCSGNNLHNGNPKPTSAHKTLDLICHETKECRKIRNNSDEESIKDRVKCCKLLRLLGR